MTRSKKLLQGLFAVAALGFGGIQVFAASTPLDLKRLCSNEAQYYCTQLCWSRGADGGMCLAGGGCRCIFY